MAIEWRALIEREFGPNHYTDDVEVVHDLHDGEDGQPTVGRAEVQPDGRVLLTFFPDGRTKLIDMEEGTDESPSSKEP